MIGTFTNRFLILLLGILTGSLAVRADVSNDYYDHNIRPIFQSRCIQCHSCYNSPCQLNLGSVEGLDRGLVNGFEVFDSAKLKPAPTSRLFIDRKNTEGWRNFSSKIRFMPVTQDTGIVSSNIDTSFILNLVEHKKANASLIFDDLKNADLMSENSRVCPDTPVKLAAHLDKRPSAGMPYGLPALSDFEIAKIREWTMMGSPRAAKHPDIATQDLPTIRRIEMFLNAYLWTKDLPAAKRLSLTSRYIYEHLFLAHIYLRDEKAPASYYRLIRSRTDCRQPDEIATRRPWDKTETPYFYYCLSRIDEDIVNKTHITYLVDDQKIERWRQLFLSTPWEVSFKGKVADSAPRGDSEANNPFFIFRDIPAHARYQFLLDNAQYHVMTFIKGPVCKGNTAVNSIDEQFYVLFMKPQSDLMVRSKQFEQEATSDLYLPARKGSGQFLGATVAYFQRKARNRFRVLRDQYYGREFPNGYSVEDIWNGKDEVSGSVNEPINNNAALTVFRHEDSAAVLKGLVGATSKTVFVLDYSIFERIYYNLVTGFDVYGDASHQLHTRLYMSYTKMEAEENFLSFFPRNVRSPMRRSWYLQAASVVEEIDKSNGDLIAGSFPLLGLEKGNQVNLAPLNQNDYDHMSVIEKLTALRKYRQDLISLFKKRLGSAVVDNNQLNPDKPLLSKSSNIHLSETGNIQDFEEQLKLVSDMPALGSPWVLKMPSAALILVESKEGPEIYSMVRNKEHLNIAWLSHEKERRNEAADTMVFYKGVMTSYPNQIFRINVTQGRQFLQEMMAVNDLASYELWISRFGSPRSGPGSERFWSTSDRIHQVFAQKYPLEYGALDYNRYGADFRFHDDKTEAFFKNLPKTLRMSVTEELGSK